MLTLDDCDAELNILAPISNTCFFHLLIRLLGTLCSVEISAIVLSLLIASSATLNLIALL